MLHSSLCLLNQGMGSVGGFLLDGINYIYKLSGKFSDFFYFIHIHP